MLADQATRYFLCFVPFELTRLCFCLSLSRRPLLVVASIEDVLILNPQLSLLCLIVVFACAGLPSSRLFQSVMAN